MSYTAHAISGIEPETFLFGKIAASIFFLIQDIREENALPSELFTASAINLGSNQKPFSDEKIAANILNFFLKKGRP